MFELSKSIQRRLHDSNFISRYFVGNGIDIGAGNDPLDQYAELFPLMGSLKIWDVGDGEAELMEGCSDGQFDFVHSSHCLEHMSSPEIALANWFRILRKGGHMIVLVPDEDMYEQGVFPSAFNPDHRWTFSIFKRCSWSARSRNVIDLLSTLGDSEILKIELLTGSYRYRLPRLDQTHTPIGEAAIEFIVRKRADEINAAGLTAKQKAALRFIAKGADIYSDDCAQTLREIERVHPKLLSIVKPQQPQTAAQRQAHFGAIATATGCAACEGD